MKINYCKKWSSRIIHYRNFMAAHFFVLSIIITLLYLIHDNIYSKMAMPVIALGFAYIGTVVVAWHFEEIKERKRWKAAMGKCFFTLARMRNNLLHIYRIVTLHLKKAESCSLKKDATHSSFRINWSNISWQFVSKIDGHYELEDIEKYITNFISQNEEIDTQLVLANERYINTLNILKAKNQSWEFFLSETRKLTADRFDYEDLINILGKKTVIYNANVLTALISQLEYSIIDIQTAANSINTLSFDNFGMLRESKIYYPDLMQHVLDKNKN